MTLNLILSAANRILFLAAFVLLALAVWERTLNAFGYTMLGPGYAAGRLLEYAGIMLLFVIAILLRQLREEYRQRGA